MALAPLRQFGLRSRHGHDAAGGVGRRLPGRASLDILGNVVPCISRRGREDRERDAEDPRRAAGRRASRRTRSIVSAQTTRVPVIDGHTETISVALDAQPVDRRRRGRAARRSAAGRRSSGCRPRRPRPIVCARRADRPQPRLDAERGGGMTVTVGRVRPCPVLDVQVRGARPQHDSRRRRRGGAQRRADAGRRPAAGRLTMATAGPIVMKFGGTSVADAEAIARVVGIVKARARQLRAAAGGRRLGDERRDRSAARARPKRPSAGATRTCSTASPSCRGATSRRSSGCSPPEPRDDVLARDRRASSTICARCSRPSPSCATHRPSAHDAIVGDRRAHEQPHRRRGAATRRRAAALGRCAPRHRDRRRAHGGGAAGRTRRATPSAREIVPRVAAGRVPVLGGFVGATPQGVTTTLGRGGSDYSAAIIGAALDAARDPDLDRRRRHADRRPARRRRRRASCRTCRSPRRPSWRTSAPRCCIRARSCRRSRRTSRSASSTAAAPDGAGTLITARSAAGATGRSRPSPASAT